MKKQVGNSSQVGCYLTKILIHQGHPWQMIALDDSRVLTAGMEIKVNLSQGIPNLVNISGNKIVQMPECHHVINVKNQKSKKEFIR